MYALYSILSIGPDKGKLVGLSLADTAAQAVADTLGVGAFDDVLVQRAGSDGVRLDVPETLNIYLYQN